jgi:hypothetical protein
MKTWLRLLIAVIEAVIVLAAIYFEPTYCVRGHLWGEMFFEDRPTSYWRDRIDHWTASFDNAEQASAVLDWLNANDLSNIGGGPGVVLLWDYKASTRQTPFWQRARFWVDKNNTNDWTPPKVLTTSDPAAELVLQELAREERYQRYYKKAVIRPDSKMP